MLNLAEAQTQNQNVIRWVKNLSTMGKFFSPIEYVKVSVAKKALKSLRIEEGKMILKFSNLWSKLFLALAVAIEDLSRKIELFILEEVSEHELFN